MGRSSAPVSQQIASLFDGVSQQIPALRLPSQATAVENAVSSPAEGVYKRPPVKYLGHLAIDATRDQRIHSVDRDGVERYHVAFDGVTVKAFTISGDDQTVTGVDDTTQAYVQTPRPRDLRCLSLEDFTFVVNPLVLPALEAVPDNSGVYRMGVSLADGITTAWTGRIRCRMGKYGMRDLVFMPGWSKADYMNAILAGLAGAPLSVDSNDGTAAVVKATEPTGMHVWYEDAPSFVTMQPVAPVREDVVYVVIKQGVQDQQYRVSIDGNWWTVSTGDADNYTSYQVTTIAANLAAAINGTAPYQATAYGNIVRVTRPGGGAPMTFSSSDTWNNMAMYALKSRVNAFEDLPAEFPGTDVVEVLQNGQALGFYVRYSRGARTASRGSSSPANATSLYNAWLAKNPEPSPLSTIARSIWASERRQFLADNGITDPASGTGPTTAVVVEGEDTGSWMECPGWGVPTNWIPTSMPHVVVSQGAGVYQYGSFTWDPRGCGDAAYMPPASFVGSPIRDLFWFRNRLGFLTDETVVLSRAGNMRSLWGRTIRQVDDDDPIDIRVTSNRPLALRSTAILDRDLILVSNIGCWVLSTTYYSNLAPRTVVVTPSVVQPIQAGCRPVTAGHTVLFAGPRGGWSTVHELQVMPGYAGTSQAQELTGATPRYIPGNMRDIEAVPHLDTVFFHSDNERSSLYVYRYLWEGNKKVQTGFSRWTFAKDVCHVVAMVDQLFVVFADGDTGSIDMADEAAGPEPFVPRLDLLRKTATTMYPNLQVTFLTLPATVTDPSQYVFVDAATGVEITGYRFVHNDVQASLQFGGLVENVYWGRRYTYRYEFSPVFMRDSQSQAIQDAQLQLKTFTVMFRQSAGFWIEVSPEARPSRTHPYVLNRIGETPLGAVAAPRATGSTRVPILTSGETCRIAMVSDSHLPCALTGAAWEGLYSLRSSRR